MTTLNISIDQNIDLRMTKIISDYLESKAKFFIQRMDDINNSELSFFDKDTEEKIESMDTFQKLLYSSSKISKWI